MPDKPRRKISRAFQFLPFNGLRGYDSLLAEAEREKTPRRERSEERLAHLNEMTFLLSKGDMAEVTWYDRDTYRTITGRVIAIDEVRRRLSLDNKSIPFQDIWDIRRLDQ